MKRLVRSGISLCTAVTYFLAVIGFLNGDNEIAFLWVCCGASLATYRQIRIENENGIIGSEICRTR